MPNDDNTTKLLTTAEIAAIYRVAAKTVRSWAVTGTVPARWTSAGYRFDLDEVEQALRLRDGRRTGR